MRRFVIVIFIAVLLGSAVVSAGQTSGNQICEVCGRTISGDLIRNADGYYHPEHLSCYHCEKPISGDYTTYEGEKYHSNCWENDVATRCDLCNAILEGEYLIDFWGNKYHQSHQNQVSRCEYCNRFISEELTGGATIYSDGRIVCLICEESSVTDIDELNDLAEDVISHLDGVGIKVDLNEIDLHLIDRLEMQSRTEIISHNMRGHVDYHESSMLGIVKSRKTDIYLLDGMPRIHAIATLAHEFMHVWQYNNGQLENDPAWREGSCNFAAYIVLQHYHTDDAAHLIETMMRDDDVAYGEGFRRVQELVQDFTIRGWLELVRSEKTFTGGY